MNLEPVNDPNGVYGYHKCYLEVQNLRKHYGKVIPRKRGGKMHSKKEIAKILFAYWDGEYDKYLLPGHSDASAKHRRINRLRQQNLNRNNNNNDELDAAMEDEDENKRNDEDEEGVDNNGAQSDNDDLDEIMVDDQDQIMVDDQDQKEPKDQREKPQPTLNQQQQQQPQPASNQQQQQQPQPALNQQQGMYSCILINDKKKTE